VKGHSNILILVETDTSCIFGGFAYCRWPNLDSNKHWEVDPYQKSFLFTLKNPHNLPARRFEMTPDSKRYVLSLDSSEAVMLSMGNSGAISLSSRCNENSDSHDRGFAKDYNNSTFANDSEYDGKTCFTGSETFTVKEVELFEFFD
jgi:hypothetical protein